MNNTTFSDIYLGLAEYIQAVLPSMTLQIKGINNPNVEALEEWAAFEILSIQDLPGQEHAVLRDIGIQITVYSRHAERRHDGKFARHLELAQLYATALNRKNRSINTSCLEFKETRIIPLDLRSIGDFAKINYQQSPSLDCMAAVVLVDAIIGSHTLIEG